jgi:hydrogenase nickel incorporation protein HypA/HybF
VHEASLALEVVGILEAQRQHLRSVELVVLEVGALACVDATALTTALQVALRGTFAEGARLEVVSTPARARCLGCGAETSPPDRVTPCPVCGSPRRTWLAGQALRVLRIEGVPIDDG